jgi:hypothetical protein
MQDRLIGVPTVLDQLVNELNHSGKSRYVGLLFPVPTRLTADLYAMVEALTHQAGTSRNKLMNQLVEIGIQATLEVLPEEIVRQLRERAGEVLRIALEENAGEGGEVSPTGETKGRRRRAERPSSQYRDVLETGTS